MSEPCPESAVLDFEASLHELQKIVCELEDGSVSLAESLARFEQGIGLLRGCYRVLEHAEQRIAMLTGMEGSGEPQTIPFDATATAEQTENAPARPGRRRATPRKTAESTPSEAAPSHEEAELPGNSLF